MPLCLIFLEHWWTPSQDPGIKMKNIELLQNKKNKKRTYSLALPL